MRTKKLLKYIPVAAALLIAIILILSLGFKDFDIANSIPDKNYGSRFLLTLSSIGGFLPTLIPVFAGFLLIFAAPKESKVTYVISIILGALFAAFFTWFAWQEGHILIIHHKVLWTILIAVFLLLMDGLLGYLAYKVSKREDKQSLIVAAILIIVICFMSICGTEGVKLIVSRPRPYLRTLDIGEYRNWFEFKPFAKIKYEDRDSFVSGHTSNAACLITTLPVLLTLTKLKYNDLVYVLGSIIGILFATIIASARVLLNDHFVCDVVGSVIVSTVVQILALLIVPLATRTTKSTNQ